MSFLLIPCIHTAFPSVHNTVMYTNRRVKGRDLLSIANHHLRQRGKKKIKSATTAWNRSAPRNKRFRQAKLHLGKGLFCMKKNTKSWRQRQCKHSPSKKPCQKCWNAALLWRCQICYVGVNWYKAYVHLVHQKDLKMQGTKKILTTCDTARHLPKYDWPEKMVYQTPAAHRIMEKEVVEGWKTYAVNIIRSSSSVHSTKSICWFQWFYLQYMGN